MPFSRHDSRKLEAAPLNPASHASLAFSRHDSRKLEAAYILAVFPYLLFAFSRHDSRKLEAELLQLLRFRFQILQSS